MAERRMRWMGALGTGGQRTRTRRQHSVDSLHVLGTALEGDRFRGGPLGVCWRRGGVQGCGGGASTNGAVDA